MLFNKGSFIKYTSMFAKASKNPLNYQEIRYLSTSNDLEIENKDHCNSEWIQIVSKVKLDQSDEIIKITHGKKVISKIKISLFPSKTKALEYANRLMNDYRNIKDIVESQYRVLEDQNGKYLEVNALTSHFFCDYDDKKLILNYK